MYFCSPSSRHSSKLFHLCFHEKIKLWTFPQLWTFSKSRLAFYLHLSRLIIELNISSHYVFTGSNADSHQRCQRSNSFTSSLWRVDCGVEDALQSLPRIADTFNFPGLLQLPRIEKKLCLLHQLHEQQWLKWIARSSIPKISVTGKLLLAQKWARDCCVVVAWVCQSDVRFIWFQQPVQTSGKSCSAWCFFCSFLLFHAI